MADHDALKAQAEEAYTLGAQYLTLADGWHVIDSTNGITTSVHPTDVEKVLRIEGNINKSPEFAVKFIGGNLAKLRESHLKGHTACEYVESFGDRSHVVRESSSYPDLGDIVQHKYYSTRVGEGCLTIVATTAKLPQYPEGHSRLVFWILSVTANEGGSHFNLVMQSHTSHPLTDEQKLTIGGILKEFYTGVITELQAAPAE